MSLIPIATILVGYLFFAYAVPLDEPVQAPATQADVNLRLPLNVKPVNYKLYIKPYLNETHPRKFTFDGECFIEIQAAQATREIRLHMKNLQISNGEYYKKGSEAKTNLPDATPDSSTDIVIYNLSEDLQANTPYILHYKYVGRMDDDMEGFYRSSYTTSKNITKWLGSTHLEFNNARRIFPSFDEPKFKATFDLSLTRHRNLKSAGPTPLIAIRPEGEYVTDVYNTTPKMSTYTLAFIVSEFNDRSDGQFGVLARPECYAQTEYSFEVGKQLLQALDKFFNMSYYSLGNEKLQFAAIPDFLHGAMENWGLVTFREYNLLYNEDQNTLSAKQEIASAVAHELSHMWFGNLVTCGWWNYLWLQEGFATYFQYYATDMVDSHLDMPKQFVVDQLQSIMGTDATSRGRPLTREKPNRGYRMFLTSITFEKGATVIRMTKHILGEENFQRSLNEYLEKHKYNNTVPTDLFAIWKKYWPSEFVPQADGYFSSFTIQAGFPVVTFNRTSENVVKVTQKRFVLLEGIDDIDSTLSYTIPITYTISTERNFQKTSPQLFLENSPATVSVNSDVKWIMGNIQETGYYRVNYDDNTWNEIKKALHARNWGGIHELNRAQIVDDLLNFARAGLIDYSLAFDRIEFLKTETAYTVWSAAFKAFDFLNMHLGTDNRDFARYIIQMTNTAYEKLGFEEKPNDTALDIYLRTKILSWACKFGKSECISKAKSYFNKNLATNPVPVNIRSVVYCTAMREGTEEDFNKLYHKYKTEKSATEKILILHSLGCVKDPKLVSEFFNKIMSPDIRPMDRHEVLKTLTSENVDLVFNLMLTQFDQLSEAMDGFFDVYNFGQSIAEFLTTETQLKKLTAFNAKHEIEYGREIFTEAVEYNVKWSKKYLGSVSSFLAKFGKNRATVATENPKLVSEYFNKMLWELKRLHSEYNENVDLVLNLMDTHIDKLSEAMGDHSDVRIFVNDIVERFTTEAKAKVTSVTSFFSKYG